MNKHLRLYTSLLLLMTTICLVFSGIEIEGNRLDSWAIHLHHIAALLYIIVLAIHLFNNKSFLRNYIKSLISH
ncbi:hypothetical protein Desor_3862 [Desulfosporosinus orientis DSM 765]|uniref:DUF4405 domain-containing protein n=1 Tax=Desulfosporosinus orientis (strain ATCC 19365 / DSM 765 / NCIMB 8382 / VKM B-1628 / Singapore I) TaxID=768706 RepID=G7WBR5_DESOD|nr:hypothetical protein Desor_3862 [Desulfosporosinus orientis DSM 765]